MAQGIFEREEDNNADIPKEKRKLSTVSYDYSVEFIVALMTSEQPKIILEVPFQRQFIWKEDRASQLIESIIMNVPIPPLYFSEEENGSWLVVDGLQRLHSIRLFFQNEYSLKKLEIIRELEGFKFKDLPPKARSLLKDGLLRINVIKKDSHPDIKYDIFMRLNKGAVSLNTQELRNCLYRGSLNSMVKDLVFDPIILRSMNLRSPHSRYLDVEFVIRYLAFTHNLQHNEEGYYIDNYKGSLKSFLNTFMEQNKEITLPAMDDLKNKVLSTFRKVSLVLGDAKGLVNPETKSNQINKAFSDCVLLSFERHEESVLQKNKTDIIRLKHVLFADQRFLPLISKRTTDSEIIKQRLTIWFRVLDNVIAS